jgi:hypothetical protein
MEMQSVLQSLETSLPQIRHTLLGNMSQKTLKISEASPSEEKAHPSIVPKSVN